MRRVWQRRLRKVGGGKAIEEEVVDRETGYDSARIHNDNDCSYDWRATDNNTKRQMRRLERECLTSVQD